MSALTDRQFTWIAVAAVAIGAYVWWKMPSLKDVSDAGGEVYDATIGRVISAQDKRIYEAVQFASGVYPANSTEESIIKANIPNWARVAASVGSALALSLAYYAYQAGQAVKKHRDEQLRNGKIFDQWGIR